MYKVTFYCDNPKCDTVVTQATDKLPVGWIQAGFQRSNPIPPRFCPVHDFCTYDCMDAVYSSSVKKARKREDD